MSYDLYFYTKKNSGIAESRISNYLDRKLVSTSGLATQWFVENEDTGAYFSIDLNEPESDQESIELFESFSEYDNSHFSFNLNFLRPDFFGQFAFEFVEKFVEEFGFYVLNPQSNVDPDNPVKVKGNELYENWSNLNRKHSIGFFEEHSLDYFPLENSNYFFRYNSAKNELQENLGDYVFVPRIFLIKRRLDNSIVTLCTWTENIPTILPEADFYFLSRKVRKWFREVEESGVISYQTLVEKFADFAVDFEFENCKIVRSPNAEKCKAVFDSIEFETDLKSFGEAAEIETVVNAKPGIDYARDWVLRASDKSIITSLIPKMHLQTFVIRVLILRQYKPKLQIERKLAIKDMIPSYEHIMLPLLQFLGDTQEHSLQESVDFLSNQFQLSENERSELLPSGRQHVFRNRLGWARTYMKKAGLLITPQRGIFKITDRGIALLAENPPEINSRFLTRYQEFVDFKSIKRSEEEVESRNFDPSEQVSNTTPEEALEYAYQKLKSELAKELLDVIKSCSPAFFEKIVVDLIVRMGYGGSRKDAGQALGKSGDGGIDGIVKEDKLGLDTIYLQAKKWENSVPVKEVRDFTGALASKKAKKGIFITTSTFPQSVYDFVSQVEYRIVLINGEQLANLMIEYSVGVSSINEYTIKKIDFDYFEES